MQNHLESYEKKVGRIDILVKAMVESNSLHGLVIAGSPGIGKSYIVDKTLSSYGDDIEVVTVKGHVTAMSMFNILSENSEENKVILMDDADNSFQDTTSLNLIKSATDHKDSRMVSWVSTANLGEQTIEFKGKIIIITNVVLSKNVHYKAILDRMISYDADVTIEEKLAKIVDMSKNSDNFTQESREAALKFLLDNNNRLSDISLRTFTKVAQLAESIPGDMWEDIASATILDKLDDMPF